MPFRLAKICEILSHGVRYGMYESYNPNIKGLGLLVSDKKIFIILPIGVYVNKRIGKTEGCSLKMCSSGIHMQ